MWCKQAHKWCGHDQDRRFCEYETRETLQGKFLLNGLGHAILGNFSTDQIVIELTKI